MRARALTMACLTSFSTFWANVARGIGSAFEVARRATIYRVYGLKPLNWETRVSNNVTYVYGGVLTCILIDTLVDTLSGSPGECPFNS